MNLLIAIDDTDSLDSRGTGHLAAALAEEIETLGWGTVKPVSRHQLYVHKDIPYTSHNSAMCFPATIGEEHWEALIQLGSRFLEKHSAPGSDPGFCVLDMDNLQDPDALIDYGQRAKKEVLTKEMAYQLAEDLNIHLSEHGGTGQGVVGALAGVALRLFGSDGRFRGKHLMGCEDEVWTAADILHQTTIDKITDQEGNPIPTDDKILLGEKVKSVLLDHQSVLLVCPSAPGDEHQWFTCSRDKLSGH